MKNSLLMVLLIASTPALAADDAESGSDSGYYAGATVGLTYYDEDDYFDNSALVGSSFDDDSVGGAIFGGYQVSRFFAVEAAYTYLGNYWEEGKGDNDDDDIETSLSALTISVILEAPVGDMVSLYLQAGLGLAFVSQTLDYDVPGVDVEENESDSGPAGQLGVGIKVNLPPKTGVQLRMGYQHFLFEADLSKVDENDDFVTEEVEQEVGYLFIGASYQF